MKASLSIRSFDKELPLDNSEILVLNKDKDCIAMWRFKINDGTIHPKTTLGTVVSLDRYAYTFSVHKNDNSFTGWCYPHKFILIEEGNNMAIQNYTAIKCECGALPEPRDNVEYMESLKGRLWQNL